MRKTKAPLRILGEFSLIVLGVMVALVADDYRQTRETAQSTQAAIRLLVSDLERDSIELSRVAGYRPGTNPNLGLILINTDRADFPADSVELAMRALLLAGPYNPVRATFDLLVQQDGLRHVGDVALQSQIISYYEEFQERAVMWNEGYLDTYNRYGREYDRFMSPRARSIEEARDSWVRGIDARLTVSWDELRTDNRFMNSVFWRQVAGQLFERYVLASVEANSALRIELAKELEQK